jgi:hypothetical protein
MSYAYRGELRHGAKSIQFGGGKSSLPQRRAFFRKDAAISFARLKMRTAAAGMGKSLKQDNGTGMLVRRPCTVSQFDGLP